MDAQELLDYAIGRGHPPEVVNISDRKRPGVMGYQMRRRGVRCWEVSYWEKGRVSATRTYHSRADAMLFLKSMIDELPPPKDGWHTPG